MTSGKIHNLLKRQLKSVFGELFTVPDEWQAFIDKVNSAYHESDMDRNMLERSMELSSQELLQTNSEMRAIFEAVPDIFLRIDALGTVLDCKSGDRSLLPVKRRDIIGQNIYSIPSLITDTKQLQNALEIVRRKKTSISFEYPVSQNGTEYSCEARLIPLLEEQTIIIIRNITDRRDAENALKRSEEFFREITVNSSDVLFIVDAKGALTYASPSVERIVGYTPDELIGKNAFYLIIPEEHARAGEDFAQALLTRDVSIRNSFRIRHKSGKVVEMEGIGKNLLHHPAIAGFIMNVRDVTDRNKAIKALRESEAKLQSIFNQIDTGVLIIDSETQTIVDVNQKVLEMSGFARERLIGRICHELICPAELGKCPVKDLCQNIDQSERTLLLADGSKMDILKTVHPIFMEERKYYLESFIDITDRKRAEEALRESEKKYRLLTEKMADIVWTADLNLHTRYISPSIKTVLGFAKDEDIPLDIEKQLTPASQAIAFDALAKELSFEEQGNADPDRKVNLVLEYYHSDGSTRFLETTVSALRDDQGTLTGLHGVSRDITERRKAEEALRESEKKYRLLTEKMADIVWIADTNLQTIYVTPSVKTVLGFTQEERMQQTIDQQFTPDSLAAGMEAWSRELANEQEGHGDPDRKAKILLEYYHKDGSTRWMETIISGLRDAQGVLTGLHGVSRDVTERKMAEEALVKSEERYRTIFENTATANVIAGDDATIIMANNNFVALCGYSKQELEGKIPWTAFVHKDDRDKMKDYFESLRRDAASIPPSCEFRAVNREGDILDLFMSAALIPDTQETIISMVDLTERKQLEEQLLQAQKMESVGRLAGGVAHDFNNMLSVIIGNTEMAMRRMDTTTLLYRTLQEILNAAMRSADLTRQLLAFARKQTANPKILDLNDTVTGMLKMLHRLIGENIELGWQPGHHLWKVKIDPSQIDQILANLTVNARDAMNKAGMILIETFNKICDENDCLDSLDSIPGEYVVLAVSDNGCGMDKEILSSIFEPFYTTKKEGQGTGLGLATVYGIVKQNGGFINVFSKPGKGTTFQIHLPRYSNEGIEATDDESEPEIQGGTETILLVEDDETVLKLGTAMLKTLGYKVLAARQADQAIQLARRYHHEIDLLLTDVVMPNMNGKDLSEQIMAIKPSLKCLFMSGYTADVIARQGILEKGIKFIAKPFSLKDLAAKVREVLR